MATSGHGSAAASPQLRLLFSHEKAQEEGDLWDIAESKSDMTTKASVFINKRTE